MAEIRTVTTLKGKRDEIARSIAAYEKKLSQAKADLAHINAAKEPLSAVMTAVCQAIFAPKTVAISACSANVRAFQTGRDNSNPQC